MMIDFLKVSSLNLLSLKLTGSFVATLNTLFSATYYLELRNAIFIYRTYDIITNKC